MTESKRPDAVGLGEGTLAKEWMEGEGKGKRWDRRELLELLSVCKTKSFLFIVCNFVSWYIPLFIDL